MSASGSSEPDPTPTAPGAGSAATLPVVRCLAVASFCAAVIHFAVAQMHYQEFWAFGVFMIATGIAQAAWAAAALLAPRRLLYVTGALLNAGIVAVYVVTRTVGDVVGPTPHEREPVGFGDAFCTGLEALLAVGCLALLAGVASGQVRRTAATWSVGAASATLSALLVVALLDGGPEMSMAADAPAPAGSTALAATTSGSRMDMTPASALTSLHLTTSSPAGAIVAPTSMAAMTMGDGMKMVTASCSSMPTTAQQAAEVQLVDRSWASAQPYRSLAAAKAAGYIPITPVGLPVVHYLNIKDYLAIGQGSPVIDPAAPDSLVYANTPHGAVLAATMYLSAPGTTKVTQPGGCLTQWHEHTNLCNAPNGLVVGLLIDGSCTSGTFSGPTAPMTHVWYVPIPGGPNATDAPDDQVVRAAESVTSPHNGTA